MFIRYKTDEKGKKIAIAKVYTPKEHPIRNSMIDKDALWAIRKLQQNGFDSYVVGGAIRDLLLGKKPKDFDIATSASPRQVQRLFWNSRIIGKRFRIVQLFFGEKIIEVTTFRSDEENFEEGNNNIFGTHEQDAHRRDFSINALYYNPQGGQIVDFTDSIADFKKRVIRSLIPLKYTFSEDPVRMIRAVKYSAITGFKLKGDVKSAIKRNSQNISLCSSSRLTEEIMKILSSGYSEEIFKKLYEVKILQHLLPCFSVYIEYPEVSKELNILDQKVKKAKAEESSIDRSILIYHFIKGEVLLDKIEDLTKDEIFKDLFRQAKILLSPATPPNYEIEKAINLVLKDYGIVQGKINKKSSKESPKRNVSQRFSSKGSTGNKNKKRRIVSLPGEQKEVEGPKTLAESHDL